MTTSLQEPERENGPSEKGQRSVGATPAAAPDVDITRTSNPASPIWVYWALNRSP